VVTYPPGAQKCTDLTSLIPYIYFKKIHASGTLEMVPLDADASQWASYFPPPQFPLGWLDNPTTAAAVQLQSTTTLVDANRTK